MKFVYQYRTSDNVRHEGIISAASRDAAFAALRAQGIRPGCMDEAPGFFNKLFGKGKRWIAIFLLAVAVIIAVALAVSNRDKVGQLELALISEDRSQIYGDPSVLAECQGVSWANVFPCAIEQLFAVYAIPAAAVNEKLVERLKPILESADKSDVLALVEIRKDDFAEVSKMKRIVNGMKLELAEFLEDDGTIGEYIAELANRQRREAAILKCYKKDLADEGDDSVWRRKNAELRAMGLPMVSQDPEKDF